MQPRSVLFLKDQLQNMNFNSVTKFDSDFTQNAHGLKSQVMMKLNAHLITLRDSGQNSVETIFFSGFYQLLQEGFSNSLPPVAL